MVMSKYVDRDIVCEINIIINKIGYSKYKFYFRNKQKDKFSPNETLEK